MESGKLTGLMIGIESVPGTKATSLVQVPFLGFKPSPKNNKAGDASAVGRIESIIGSEKTEETSEPSLQIQAYDENIGILFKAIFGTSTPSPDTPEVGVITHDLIVKNDNDPITLSLVWKDNIGTKMITNAIVNTAKIQMVKSDFVKIDLTFIGNIIQTTTDTFALSAENVFVGTDVTVKTAANLAGLDAALGAPFTDASVEINKNGIAVHVLNGETNPYKIINGDLVTTGSIAKKREDDTYFDAFNSFSKQAIRFEAVKKSVTIGAATNPSFRIDIAKTPFAEWDEDGAGSSDLKEETFNLEGEYDSTQGAEIVGRIVNTVTSY